MSSSRVNVDLADRSYSIEIGAGLLGREAALAPHVSGGDAFVISNATVAPLYADALTRSLGARPRGCHILPDGEAFKTLAQIREVYDTLTQEHANRDTTIVALGGGVVGDMAGFVAATYQRGVPFIQVPTTLLAQVDSSVGGKTGVNHERGKNLIGAFHQPTHVLIDTDTLATLADREYSSGLAEVIKYGLVHDADFFGWLESNMAALRGRDPAALRHAIARSCEIKAVIVAADERERGQRALLNFGHTFGHAIETAMGYGQWLHGEAVAAGMVMAAIVGDLPERDQDRIRALLGAAGLPTAPPSAGAQALREAMQMDKKITAGRLRLVLLEAIGKGYVSADFDQSLMTAALQLADE